MSRLSFPFLALTLALSTTAHSAPWWRVDTAPPAPATDWKIEGQLPPADPKDLTLTAGAKWLTITSQSPLPAARTFQAWLRLRNPEGKPATALLTLGKHNLADPKDPAVTVAFTSAPATNSVTVSCAQNGKPLIDNKAQSENLDWLTTWPNTMVYRLRAYNQALPGWDEDFRVRVEHDMNALPGVNDKWLRVRAEMKPGLIAIWIDDRLVTTKQSADIDPTGYCTFNISPGAQCRGLENVSNPEAPGFNPIQLGGYTNAAAFLNKTALDEKSLPPVNELVKVGQTPFVFPGRDPEGHDHIDIGTSFLRQGLQTGYLPTYGQRLGGADQRDPARIQLRIPFKNYRALHLIAAADSEPNSVPLITAQFYRPSAGFTEDFESSVPLATATGTANPLGVRLVNGKAVNLYHVTIPLDPGRLSAFSDLNVFEVEFTKKVELWRSYPDPINYGSHPAGLPSGVHVYAATLEETPVTFTWSPDNFGHVWTAEGTPGYTAKITNASGTTRAGKLTVTTSSYDGTETHQAESAVTLPAGTDPVSLQFNFPVKLNGYHDITATLTLNDGFTWTEKRSFVRLAPDTRSARWTPGKGILFGYWSYHGGHYTPKADRIIRLMTLAGARTSIAVPPGLSPETMDLIKTHWSPVPAGAWDVIPQTWAADEPLDPEKVAKFQAETIAKLKKYRDNIPEGFKPDHVYYFAEPHISSRLSAGNIPEYWGEKPYEFTAEEAKNLRMFMNTSRMASEAVRREFPDLKILAPWGDPGFIWPILRAGFPKEMIDGSGIDIPGFERMPERQLHEQSIHRLYMLKKEFAKAGIPNPQLRFCEGIFVPTEPGAVSYREQMDIYSRFALIAMSYGFDRFYSSWFAFDCGSYYGAEHYGGCGIQRRIPYCDPKPAYAAYATMTRHLNGANFQGWLKTGSLSGYALHFQGPAGHVYPVWNLRGRRAVTLTIAGANEVQITDSMDNTRNVPVQNGKAVVETDPSVRYISFTSPIAQVTAIEAGPEDNSDSTQPAGDKPLADLGDGTWRLTNERDTILENNHWAVMHYPGKFSTASVPDLTHGKVLQTTLEKQDTEHQLMPWYNVLRPAKPITIPGAPSHLGLWVKANSDWGRFIYVLKDAKGESWYSIGEKNQYNCDDVHSWSMFNFDGWRYLDFELPGNSPWDGYREAGSTWWRFTAEGKVDLPLTLESVIVEQRTHILYVNDIQPVPSNIVQFGKLFVRCETPENATPAAVTQSRLQMPKPEGAVQLPNPIADLEKTAAAPATKLLRLEEPVHYADGTRMHVFFEEVPEAAKYYLYCSPYPDGSGAVNMMPAGIKNGQLVYGFRPGVPLYFWIVWEGKEKKLSKPSAVLKQVLVDNFKEK